MDFKYICRWGDHERKGLHLRCGLTVSISQPPWRGANFLILTNNSPEGSMAARSVPNMY